MEVRPSSTDASIASSIDMAELGPIDTRLEVATLALTDVDPANGSMQRCSATGMATADCFRNHDPAP